MSDELLPAKVRLTAGLGPLPEPVAWFRAPYGTLEPNPLFRVTGPQSLEWAVACFTETQLRAAVAAERERCAKLCEAEAEIWQGEQDITDFRLCAARIRSDA
jgi:hypothetical protein